MFWKPPRLILRGSRVGEVGVVESSIPFGASVWATYKAISLNSFYLLIYLCF